MKFAEVAVNSPSVRPRTFTYSIPQGTSLVPGQAVWVPFGPRRLQGIVLGLTDVPGVEATRDIIEVIAPEPLLSTTQLELARWMGEYYLSSFFDAASLMLPPGFEQRVLIFVEPAPNPSERALASLSPRQKALLALLQGRGAVELGEIRRELRWRDPLTVVDQLLRKGVVGKTAAVEPPRLRHRVVAYLRLALPKEALERAYSSLQRAPRQQDLLQLLEASPEPIPLPELRATFSAATIDPLVARGFVASEERVIYRDPLASRVFEVAPSPPLTTQQEVAWEEVRAALESGRSATFLLHGITGSGKTEVYLRALAHAVAQGRRGIVLVPEIALTPQMVRRFASRFPERVAVFHSALSSGELFDEWWRTKNGEFDVAIGSRSALFAPQSPLGLIVLDEEHEWTYKEQEQSPRYHARDVALRLAELTGAVVILGSATPDLVSYHEARRGRHRFLALPERYHQKAELPEVRLIDLRAELREGNRSIFSRALQGAMAQALERREQVILFLNRRGSASFVQCRDCGHVLRCRRCEAPLTYHSAEEDLACHLCNLRRGIPRTCPNCRSPRIRYLGIGTQRVEEEVRKAFPQARTLRWDRDVTQGRHSHEAILDRFSAHEADVLIGTQMVAKGLDLPLVTLVGVINADIGLHLPDFRSAERTFQLLTQVAGRAGRGTLPGQVVIQSYNPDHYAVQAVLRHDYEGFYRREASFRRSHGYPPFGRLVRLLFSHSNYARSQAEAQRLGELLREAQDYHGLSNIDLIGPVPCYTHRLRGRYRWQIVLRGDDPERLLEQAAVPSGWQVDVDPVSLL